METQQNINYNRIALAIEFYRNNFKLQPTLEQVAEHVCMSPFHFQRMFKEWAGVTPKQFLQFLSLEHAKSILKETPATVSDAAFETGLSGSSRLHDLFVKIEGMTPGEYKNGGRALNINYSFDESLFGRIIVAATSMGICYMAFADADEQLSIDNLVHHFPNAFYQQRSDAIQQKALLIFQQDWSRIDEIKLHLKGTAFQIKVWETLLKIPPGKLSSYAAIAEKLDNPKACRAVGSAVGDNPVAILIPCHRVVRSSGEMGDYHWGRTRKSAIIGWESARSHPEPITP